MGVSLELFLKTGKIRRGLAVFVDAPRGWPEQDRFQLAIIPAFRQRPPDPRRLGAFQVRLNPNSKVES
jgi:hypothetical protein